MREGINTPCGKLLPATASALLTYLNPNNPSINTVSTTTPIIIEGKFKVDRDIIFNGSNIRFAKSPSGGGFSGMEVDPGRTLNITNSTLQAGCNYMWDGINALTGTGAVTISGSVIRDMERGVIINGNVIASFTNNNQFLNNLNSIQLTQNTLSIPPTITGNNFQTTPAGLLPPFTGQIGLVGISAYNCQKLYVGPPNATGTNVSNTFDNLKTGVNINIDGGFLNPVALDYRLFNNNFNNITGSQFGMPVSPSGTRTVYNDAFGTAIFVKNANKSNNAASLLQVDYASGNPAGFTGCEKAVTVSNLSTNANNMKVRDGIWGISIGQPEKNNYTLRNNKFTNNYRGIDIVGTPNIATVNKDTFSSRVLPLNGNGRFNGTLIGPINGDPVGISLTNFLALNNSSITIDSNDLTINSVGGTGIVLQNAGRGAQANSNTIRLSPMTVANPNSTNPLLGISLNDCMNTKLLGNNIKGNTSMSFLNHPTIKPQRDVVGISMSASKGLEVKNNSISFLKYGFLVVGDCGTAADAVAGNCFLYHQSAMLFRQLGSSGAFGNIGTPNNDNNNRFNGTVYNLDPITGQRMKVHTVMTMVGNTAPTIFTDQFTVPINLNQSQSTSNIAGGAYFVRQPNPRANVIPACNLTPVLTSVGGNWGLMFFDTSAALDVARDSVIYPYFQDVAKWLADKELYEVLSNNPAALFSQPEFTVFYAQQDGTVMKYVQNTDSFLAGMGDPAVWSDETVWEAWLAAAQGANGQIVSPEVQEQNEAYINDAYMRYLEGGFDTLNNENDSALIASLALSCPFINGSAVYKARMLYSYWVPAEAYSDLELCNSAGYYKGGRSWLAEQNELLNSYQLGGDNGSVESAAIEQPHNIIIAPNPGTGLFTAEVLGKDLKDGVLEVYNLLGQKVTSIALKSSSVQFNLSGNAAGVYYYQCKEAGVVVSSGKLILNP